MTVESAQPPVSVLIVDDEEAVAYTLSEILATEGYEVATATSVVEAFGRIDERHFDAAVVDLNVGEESGLTVLNRLRERSPFTAAVLLTGFGSLETAVQAMRQGAFDYLMKPCDVDELKASLARGVGQRRRERLAAESQRAATALTQALAAAERARDDFLTIAGHELKTPLAALIGWAQLTQRQLQRGTAEGAVERLDAVVQQAQRLARMVEAIAELAHLAQGTRALAPAAVDLRPHIRRAVDEILARAPAHAVNAELPAEAVAVHADPGSIDLVLRSLLDNAIKFSPGGGPVTVRVRTQGHEALVSVEDRGIGIDAGELERIFERFHQADGDVLSRRFGGLGAGLYLSRALVQAQGGRIWAESPGPEQGSRFVVALPLA
jgi:signal transduction histidine kinase